MKKHSIFTAVLCMLFAVTFTSCDSEPVDSELVNTEDSGNNNGNGPGSNGGSDTSGSYWPMAVNNEWNYDAGTQGPYAMKINGTENINGVTYYKYEDFIANVSSMPQGTSAASTAYSRKDNNDYNIRISFTMEMQPGMPQMSMSPMEFTILKDNIAAGQTWTQQVQQTLTMEIPGMDETQEISNTLTVKGTIVEKSESAVLDGVTYNDVIKVKIEQSMLGEIAATSYYWFVRNKGIMKALVDTADTDTDINYVLESYTVN